MSGHIDVVCDTGSCRSRGAVKRVWLRLAAAGVLDMPCLICQWCRCEMRRADVLLRCESCTTLYAPDLAACPHCGSGDRHEEGESPMAKITVHGGPSNRHDPQPRPISQDRPAPEPASVTPEPEPVDLPPEPVRAATLPDAADVEREAEGTGTPGEAIDLPADGVMRETVIDEPSPAAAPETATPAKTGRGRRPRS